MTDLLFRFKFPTTRDSDFLDQGNFEVVKKRIQNVTSL